MPTPEELEAYDEWLRRRTGPTPPATPPLAAAGELTSAPAATLSLADYDDWERRQAEVASIPNPSPAAAPRTRRSVYPPGEEFTPLTVGRTAERLSTGEKLGRLGRAAAGAVSIPLSPLNVFAEFMGRAGAQAALTDPEFQPPAFSREQRLPIRPEDLPSPFAAPGELLRSFEARPFSEQVALGFAFDPTIAVGPGAIRVSGRVAGRAGAAAREAVPLTRPLRTAAAAPGRELDRVAGQVDELTAALEAANTKLDEAAANLEANLGRGRPAPKFGTTERTEFDVVARGRVSKVKRVAQARLELRQARQEASQVQRDLDSASQEYDRLLGEPVTEPVSAESRLVPVTTQPVAETGAIQAGMDIGERPAQGTLGLGGQIEARPSAPLIDAGQVAERQRLATERAAGQAALPETAAVAPPTAAAPPGGAVPPGIPPVGAGDRPPGAALPPPPTPPPAGSLTLGTPGENAAVAALRKYEGTRTVSGLETRRWLEDGDQLFRNVGVTAKRAGRPVVPQEVGEPVIRALHGEGTPPAGYEHIVADLQEKMAQETADMLAADPSFSKRMIPGPDYFPRMWNLPKKTPKGGPRLGTKPFFLKQRSDLSFGELRELGYEPVSWNPYEMLAFRRMAGTDYRDGLVFIDRLKKMGKAVPLDEVPPLEKGQWRVPEVGPAFEGRPFPTATGSAAMTQPIAVPNQVASVLEGMFGKRPSLEIAGKDIVSTLGFFSQAAKRAKLMGSLFQHIDFGTRVGAEALSPTAILNGTTVNFPRFLAGAVRGQFSETARQELRQRLLSDVPIMKGTSISMRILVEEGLQVGGDTTVLRRSIRSFLDDIGKTAPASLPGRAWDRLGAVNRFFERGLFENIYPLAQEWAVKNHIVPVLKATHPKWTDQQIAGQAARDANVMFSNLGNWQTVFAQPAMKELTRQLIFSTNEAESWIRSAVATVHGPSKRLWLEHWIGLGILLAGLANLLHKTTTGEWLPGDRYIPVSKSPYGPTPVNYNSKFLSPDIPLKDKQDENMTLDLMGQADTILRFALDPQAAVESRENVIPRALITQATGKTFGGKPLKTPQQRLATLGVELAAPIGVGEVAQIARERSPVLEGLIPGSEVKLGAKGHALQAAGVNVRSPRTDIELLQIYQEGIGPSLAKGHDRDLWKQYHQVQGIWRDDWLKVQPLSTRLRIKSLLKQQDVYRTKLRKNNPILDVLLVERGMKPLTTEGKQRQNELRKKKLGVGGPRGIGEPPSPEQLRAYDEWLQRNPVYAPTGQ